MPIFNWKGFSAKKAQFLEGTIRAKDSTEAIELVFKKRLGGSGEVCVWPKKGSSNGTKKPKTKPKSGPSVGNGQKRLQRKK